jgi:hypothetical protein
MNDYQIRFQEMDSQNISGDTEQANSRNRQRGLDFEKLILELFDSHGLLIRSSYHTHDNKSEQIDGAIKLQDRFILVETKWVQNNLAASDLYSFIGKVENKFIGTIGVFISRNELSENFLNSLNKGRRQCVIVIHNKDVIDLFSDDFPIPEYLNYCIQMLSIENLTHISTINFLKFYNAQKNIDKSKNQEAQKNDKAFEIAIDIISDKKYKDPLILKATIDKNQSILKPLITHLLRMLPELYLANLGPTSYNKESVYRVLTDFSTKIENLSDLKATYLTLFISSDYSIPFLMYGLPKVYLDIDMLDEPTKAQFFDKLYDVWYQNRGQFDEENRITTVIKNLWEKIPEKDEYLNDYFRILNSSRRYGFDQKDFAKELFIEKDNSDYVYKFIDKYISEDLKEFPFERDEEQVERDAARFLRDFSATPQSLKIDEEETKEYLKKRYKRVKSRDDS